MLRFTRRGAGYHVLVATVFQRTRNAQLNRPATRSDNADCSTSTARLRTALIASSFFSSRHSARIVRAARRSRLICRMPPCYAAATPGFARDRQGLGQSYQRLFWYLSA